MSITLWTKILKIHALPKFSASHQIFVTIDTLGYTVFLTSNPDNNFKQIMTSLLLQTKTKTAAWDNATQLPSF